MIIISPILRLIASILTFVLYVLTALSCFGGSISPEIWTLPSVLTLGMPVLVTASAIVTLLWFIFGHWIIGSLGIVMFLVCASPIRMWFPMAKEEKPTPGGMTFTVLTWNILHGADISNPDYAGSRTIETIIREDADIVCLQEIFGFNERFVRHFTPAMADTLAKMYPYQLGDGTYDLRILSKFPLRHAYFGSVNKLSLAEYFTVDLPMRRIAMANVHLPSFHLNAEEASIFQTTINVATGSDSEHLGLEVLRKLEHAFPIRAEAAEKVNRGFEDLSMPVIVVGDFNDVPASWVYRSFLKSGFKDAYAQTNFFPTNTYNLHGLYFKLDQVFYRGDVKPLKVERIKLQTSDHYPLKATFELMPQ